MNTVFRRLLLTSVVSAAGSVSAATLTNQYTFAGNGNDSVGTANLTATGTVTFGTATIAGNLANIVTISGNPDGNTNASSFLTSGVISLNAIAGGDGAISFWANAATMTNSFNDAVNLSNGATSTYKFESSGTGNPLVIFGPTSFAANTTTAQGAWHNYIFTFSAGTGSYYVDGVQSGASAALTGTTVATKLVLGTDPNTLTRGWNGSIADVRIYDSGLNASEIAAISASAVPEPTTYGLMGAGVLASIACVRRRKRA